MKDNSVIIKAVGDIAPGNIITNGSGIVEISKKYGCHYLFEKIKNELANADLVLGNLEGTFSQFCKTKDIRLCGLPEMAFALHDAGFHVLSVANNHVLDHGSQIFEETIYHCQTAGLMVCGLKGDRDYFSQPIIIQRNGLTIGILAYNWIGFQDSGNAGNYIATIHDGIVNYSWIRDRERDLRARSQMQFRNKGIISDIRKLRRQVDILILMPHWGYEWTIYPPYGVTLEARSFINAGVDLILGSHPHVPQGIEMFNNKLIAYSLGNFLFERAAQKYRHGMMLSCIISPCSIPEYTISIIDRDKHFRPKVISDKAAASTIENIQKSSNAIISGNARVLLDDDAMYKEYEKGYNYLKFIRIIYLARMMLHQPSIIIPVIKKFINLMNIFILKIRGKKVRW